jgi:hypothetical protein
MEFVISTPVDLVVPLLRTGYMLVHLAPNLATMASVTIPAIPFWAIKSGLKLLFKPYFGRVKLIYIDLPYNTGQDFVYPDNYADSLQTYLQLTGQADAEGNLLTSNPETSGRYHSSWLSMMYPRLFLARQLPREDGVICVSIDDHEVHHLRVLMNEVFGEENFVECFIWKRSYRRDTCRLTASRLPKQRWLARSGPLDRLTDRHRPYQRAWNLLMRAWKSAWTAAFAQEVTREQPAAFRRPLPLTCCSRR